eukprot:6443048-Pyramimonas_sp.AAC.1
MNWLKSPCLSFCSASCSFGGSPLFRVNLEAGAELRAPKMYIRRIGLANPRRAPPWLNQGGPMRMPAFSQSRSTIADLRRTPEKDRT